MLRLGLGHLRLGGRRGPSSVAPSFTTNPTITDQPLVGAALALGEFSYAGTAPVTPSYAWELDGVPIGGATASTYTPVSGDFGKTLSCVVTLTGTGTPAVAEATATAVVGNTLAETWAARTVGDTWTTIDANGFTRTSTAISANIITDVAPAPSLKSAEVHNTTSNPRAIYRDDMAAFVVANTAEIDFMEGLHLNRHHNVAGGRYGVRGWNALTDATLTPILFGPHIYQNRPWLQISTDIDTNSGSLLGSDLVEGDKYWMRYRYTATEVWAKIWLHGVAEPTLWEKRACTPPYNGAVPALCVRNATTGGAVVYDNLYFATGWNAVAPFPVGHQEPVPVSSDPQTFAAATAQSTITAMDSLVTFTLASAGSVGRYLGGAAFVTGSWPQISSVSPASALVATVAPATETGPTWRHGLEVVTNMTGRFPNNVGGGSGPSSQPYDGRTEDFGGNGPLTYDGALNFDPGKTGSALTITTPCTVIKAVSKTDPEVNRIRNFLKARVPVFFIDHTPATDSLPPPIGAVPLVSKFVKTNINFAVIPNVTVTDGGPSVTSLLNRHRWLKQYQMSERPKGDYYCSSMAEDSYASDSAADYAERMMSCCMNIDSATKEWMLIHTVIDAQNIVESLKAGARFNTPGGLGGILAGHKLAVVVAAILTGDSEITSWAQRTDWAAEDRQCFAVTQSHVDTYDYVADDLAMPEWSGNPILDTSGITRSLTASTYRRIFLRHHIGQAIAAMMIPGAKAMWNHAPFFDLADRYMQRTIYKDGASTNQWARTLSGSNAADPWHIAVWDAHRSDGGMPAIWNWPA